jgi:hypothetical protein
MRQRRLACLLMVIAATLAGCVSPWRDFLTEVEVERLDRSCHKLKVGMKPEQAIEALALPPHFVWSNLTIGDDTQMIVPIRIQSQSSLCLVFEGAEGSNGLRTWTKEGPAWVNQDVEPNRFGR